MSYLNSQLAAKLERRNASFGLPDQIEGLKPSGESHLYGLHDRAGRKSGLMATGAALITLEPSPVSEAMLMAIAAWAAKHIRPASLLQPSLTLLLSALGVR